MDQAYDLACGLARSAVGGQAPPEGTAEALQRLVPGLAFFSICLVGSGSSHLLVCPVLDAGAVPGGPLKAVAKCSFGSAAWLAFSAGRAVHSRSFGPARPAGEGPSSPFPDWELWGARQPLAWLVALPLASQEGQLGAVNCAVAAAPTGGPEGAPEVAPELALERLQALAAMLGQALAHQRTRHDLQAAKALLQRMLPPAALRTLLPESSAPASPDRAGPLSAVPEHGDAGDPLYDEARVEAALALRPAPGPGPPGGPQE